jgi:hypothetical protein
MKKVTIKFLVTLITASLLSPAGFAAKTVAECNALTGSGGIYNLKNASFSDLIDCATPQQAQNAPISPMGIISLIITFIGGIAILLSILGIILGILWMATSSGDKTKYENATAILKNSVIALIIIITANQILALLLNQFGFTL